MEWYVQRHVLGDTYSLLLVLEEWLLAGQWHELSAGHSVTGTSLSLDIHWINN